MALDEDAAVKAIMRVLSAHQVSAVDGLAVLSVVAASGIIYQPRDMQAALLRGFQKAVGKKLASMQAEVDRGGGGY